MKISYVTTYDASDIHNWSGLGYMIAKTLENQGSRIDFIGDLQSSPSLEMYLKKLYFKLLSKDFDFGREIHTAQQYAKQIKARIKADSDIVFSPGTIPISMLDVVQPKVFYTDATFAGMVGFYDYLSNLSPSTIKSGNELEKNALDSCKLAIYSSEWAANTAIEYYGADPAKIKVVPFGSNIESGRDLNEIKSIVSSKNKEECNLLFLGVDWDRKGGNIALEVVNTLNQSGLNATLHIAGVKNFPFKETPEYVRNYGFISKSNPEGVRLMDKLMAESHFLLLPTRADCTPVVFSEANAFGIPCITTSVGGIPTIIRDDVNGKAFPLQAEANEYASYIEKCFKNWDAYYELSLSSFNEYESRLNWNVTGKVITKLMSEL
jgi:glycosyltransferase involved in cell wall biosynthesis